MATLDSTSLEGVKNFTVGVLKIADDAFKTATQGIDSGGTLTLAKATEYQAQISQYSLISQIMSAVIKELVDSMKAIANKI